MDESKIKMAMMTAAAKSLEYMKRNPKASEEEIFQHVMKVERASGNAKIGAMAAVSRAYKYKQSNPKDTDKKIMQAIMNESEEILANMTL